MKEYPLINKIIESLSPNERKVISFLNQESVEDISEKSGLDKTSVLRALEFLSKKDIVRLSSEEKQFIDLGVNGILYSKKELPERRLASTIAENNSLTLNEAKKISGLNDNEFKAAIGVLKKKALISLINERIALAGNIEEIIHKTLEEKFLESLPRDIETLRPEEKFALQNLKNRKNIVELQKKKIMKFEVSALGKKLMNENLKVELIESITSDVIKKGLRGKKFRRYDITSQVPRINGGKRHFVNESTDYAKRIWMDMGFKEMEGDLCQSGFWNFDALFTPQDHPVREMQDTFFIEGKESKLPDKRLVEEVKRAHEGGVGGSKGWQYTWKEKDAKKVVLRTHTTCLSARTLVEIAKKKEFPAKYFALGKCFRNETVDWSHGFEFNQTEGIVVDENANFRQLLGYLVEFFKKMGYEKIRIRPGYFPYTEPSLEIDVFHPIHKKWMELGGAGMFRPELTIPIFGKHIPVLAWGPGFDRIIMEFFRIEDLRELYKNDLNKLRQIKIWNK